MKYLRSLVVFVLLIAATVVLADEFDIHCANIGILTDRKVQADMGVTQLQRDNMNTFANAYNRQMQSYSGHQLTSAEQKQAMAAGEQFKRQVLTVLTGPQVKRLRELNLQAAGLIGLLDPIVATRVGMSAAQQKQFTSAYSTGKTSAARILADAIAPIVKKYQQLAAPYKGKEKQNAAKLEQLKKGYVAEVDAKQKSVAPRVNAITKATEQKLRASLTAQQRATWLALEGKKFVPK